MDDFKDKDRDALVEETYQAEEKISKGVKIFIGAFVGCILGATLSTVYALLFFPLDNGLADFEVLFFSGTIGGALIGGYFYNVFAVIAAALGWMVGLDIDM